VFAGEARHVGLFGAGAPFRLWLFPAVQSETMAATLVPRTANTLFRGLPP